MHSAVVVSMPCWVHEHESSLPVAMIFNPPEGESTFPILAALIQPRVKSAIVHVLSIHAAGRKTQCDIRNNMQGAAQISSNCTDTSSADTSSEHSALGTMRDTTSRHL